MSGRVLLEAHVHTAEVSRCGQLRAEEVIEALRKSGYQAAVITDHYLPGERQDRAAREAFLEGYRKAREAGERCGMTVLPGLEIRFANHGEDFLVYGLTEEEILSLPDDACEAGLRRFHAHTQSLGALIYQAHPFRAKHLPANPADIDGMETFNGNPRHNSQNRLAAAFATRHVSHTIAGSDIHRAGDAGTVGLLVPPSALTPKGLAKWLSATPHPRVQFQEPPVDGIRYVAEAIPGREMLSALYQDAGWTNYTKEMDTTMASLRHSLRVVTAWDDTQLIGMARAIGDGHTILYVQDLLVLGTYQRRGIGRGLLRRLLAPYPSVRQVVLISDDVAENRGFYEACGFQNAASLHCVAYLWLK